MLFGGKKDDANDEAMKKMGEQMQKLSEMIGELQQKLAAKTAEADGLRTQAAHSSANEVALKDAQAQMEVLRNQINDLQSQAQKQAAAAQAAAAQPATQASAPAAPAGTAAGHSVGGGMKQVLSADEPATGGLAAGATAYVTRAGGLALRLRSGPSLNDSVKGSLPPGTQMTLLDGPRQADGHGWWHIRTADGREGWVAGEDLRTQPD
jgi:uncharacterized protein YgiM (DUF1202 family)